MGSDARCDWCNEGVVAVVYRNGWDRDADYGVCVACDAELAAYRDPTRIPDSRGYPYRHYPDPEWQDCKQCGMRYLEEPGVPPGACPACVNSAA